MISLFWIALFWIAAATVAYSYVGYAAWLWVREKIWPWPVLRGASLPQVSAVMVVRNEEKVLEDKLRNLLELDYPAERLQIVVVSDGSTDGTERILREAAKDSRVTVLFNQLPQGKAAGLNDGLAVAQGDVILFTDARQKIEGGALRLLAESFADPAVGAMSGELMLGDPASGESAKGMGLYWRIEKMVRRLESASGSVVGATGAIYAAKRELIPEVPPGTILDDVFIPMHVAKQGARVLFDPRAKAWDDPDLGAEREFRRKVRTLAGNYQLLQLAPWMLRSENPLRFEFISHKLMRLVVPFALALLLISSWFAGREFYRVLFWMQIAGYGLSGLGSMRLKLGPLSRLTDVAHTFVVLNAAAVVAFWNFATGQKAVWMQSPAGKEMRA